MSFLHQMYYQQFGIRLYENASEVAEKGQFIAAFRTMTIKILGFRHCIIDVLVTLLV